MDKYPPLFTDTEMNNCLNTYYTTEWPAPESSFVFWVLGKNASEVTGALLGGG